VARFDRFVALGDSFTEGLHDEVGPTDATAAGPTGWPSRSR
jgi:hypothetical protein